jgi:hypothetical protein
LSKIALTCRAVLRLRKTEKREAENGKPVKFSYFAVGTGEAHAS